VREKRERRMKRGWRACLFLGFILLLLLLRISSFLFFVDKIMAARGEKEELEAAIDRFEASIGKKYPFYSSASCSTSFCVCLNHLVLFLISPSL